MKKYVRSNKITASIDLIQKLGYIQNDNGRFDVCVVESPYADMQLATYDPQDDEYDLLDKVGSIEDAYQKANDLFKTQGEYVVTASRKISASDDSSMMNGYKYVVYGGPQGDYIGDYDEDLANYYGQNHLKDFYTNDPEAAVFAWFKAESMYPMDVAICTDKNTYAKQLCQWVVDHEDTFKKMYNRVDCHYKYDYLFDGAIRYATKDQIIEKYGFAEQIFPFCYG